MNAVKGFMMNKDSKGEVCSLYYLNALFVFPDADMLLSKNYANFFILNVQLLCHVVPSLVKLRKEGLDGHEKIKRYMCV